MSGTAWAAFLDSLESELLAVQRATPPGAAGSVPRAQRGAFAAPDLGPLPAELADRARDLLGQLRAAEAAVHAELEATSRQIRELRAMDPRAPRPASGLDTRA